MTVNAVPPTKNANLAGSPSRSRVTYSPPRTMARVEGVVDLLDSDAVILLLEVRSALDPPGPEHLDDFCHRDRIDQDENDALPRWQRSCIVDDAARDILSSLKGEVLAAANR